LQLHDVRDADAFVSSVIARSAGRLSYDERERLVQFLRIEIWRLAERYEPGGITFSTYAGRTLPRRITDWRRTPEEGGRTFWSFGNGRTYERERPKVVSLDADASLRDRLDSAQSTRSGDPADDCSPDLERLLADGDRQRARDLDTLGLEADRRTAGRAQGIQPDRARRLSA
jgi:hypothetical protein